MTVYAKHNPGYRQSFLGISNMGTSYSISWWIPFGSFICCILYYHSIKIGDILIGWKVLGTPSFGQTKHGSSTALQPYHYVCWMCATYITRQKVITTRRAQVRSHPSQCHRHEKMLVTTMIVHNILKTSSRCLFFNVVASLQPLQQ